MNLNFPESNISISPFATILTLKNKWEILGWHRLIDWCVCLCPKGKSHQFWSEAHIIDIPFGRAFKIFEVKSTLFLNYLLTNLDFWIQKAFPKGISYKLYPKKLQSIPPFSTSSKKVHFLCRIYGSAGTTVL